MENSLFAPAQFFDMEACTFAELFNGCFHVWEVLPKIGPFLRQQSLGCIQGQISPQAFLESPELISIGEGSVVEAGAYIRGPCMIGKGCTIRHGAYIRGNLLTGDGCVIGHDTEIKNVILFNHAKAAHFAYLGDSILGNEVNLGAGTICANLKLDKSLIIVHHQEMRMNTGLKKFGAILGDRSQTGCNSVTNPGTLFEKDVFCHPCVNVGGVIPAGHIVKSSTSLVIAKKR